MDEKITVKDWIKQFNNGDFKNSDFSTQVKAGWYDWFCKDTSLKNKTDRMGRIIKKITNEKILDGMYVFFKNSCPVSYPLYDQFKFCDLKNDNEVIYCINIDCKYEKFKYVVYGKENGFEDLIFGTDESKELINFFNNL